MSLIRIDAPKITSPFTETVARPVEATRILMVGALLYMPDIPELLSSDKNYLGHSIKQMQKDGKYVSEDHLDIDVCNLAYDSNLFDLRGKKYDAVVLCNLKHTTPEQTAKEAPWAVNDEALLSTNDLVSSEAWQGILNEISPSYIFNFSFRQYKDGDLFDKYIAESGYTSTSEKIKIEDGMVFSIFKSAPTDELNLDRSVEAVLS